MGIVVIVDEPDRITGMNRDGRRLVRVVTDLHGDNGTCRGSVRQNGDEREKREADQKVFHIRYMPPEP